MLTIVSYHHFADHPGSLAAGLGVTTSTHQFGQHLAFYRRWYNLVSLDAVLAGDLPPRALLLTIDDAFRSVFVHALPMLKAANVPAVLFTNPRVVTGNYVPLDSVLALAHRRLGAATIVDLLAGIAGTAETLAGLVRSVLPTLTVGEREALRSQLLAAMATTDEALCRSRPFLTADDLRAIARSGMAIGNHTASHVHGRSLAGADLGIEIDAAKSTLEAITDRPVRAFSFPYGNLRDATPTVLNRLRQSGHQALFLVQARANRRRPAADLWFRVPMQNDPVTSLPAKLMLLPRLRSWRTQIDDNLTLPPGSA